jgi:[protein-PII] uridylyltransferase
MDSIREKIDELLHQDADDFVIAKILKSDIQAYFTTLDESFENSGGKDFLVKHTRKIDSMLKLIFAIAARRMFEAYQPMKNTLPLVLVALGSYGREELCVHSDIDLMIVYKDIPGYNLKEIIEKILYLLWDSGLKLGHRVHNINELLDVSRSDNTIKTAMIESRYIEGSSFLWTWTQNALNAIRHDDIETFISLKLTEQDQMHIKFPFTMQPNLKEGVGGLRDANLVYWIGKARYNIDRINDLPETLIDEHAYREFRIALEFIFRVRSALHLVTGKKEDILHLDLIPSVAHYLGYRDDRISHVKFAGKVFSCLKIIQLYTTIWADLLCADYPLHQTKNEGLLPPVAEKEPHSLLDLLKLLDHYASDEYRVSPALLCQLLEAPKPARLTNKYTHVIRDIFRQKHAHSALNAIWEARLLSFVIPSVNKVIDLPQFDGYHEYPVDAHLLQCLYCLEHIKDEAIKTIFDALEAPEKEMLKIVTFMHDAGKGRIKSHSLVGASLFKAFAKKLGLSEALIEDGATLIQYHTLMSNVAQREDLYSEKTILEFASHFKTKKMIDMIYILTYADLNGVGDRVYNSFNASLIQTLYTQSLEALEHGSMLDETAKRVEKEEHLKRTEQFKTLPSTTQKMILSIPSNLMFLRYRPEQIIRIATEGLQTKQFIYKISNSPFLTIELTRKEDFQIGYMLSKLSRLNLVNMDICKLSNDLKYFKFDFSEPVEDDEIPFIKTLIHESFGSKKTPNLSVPVITEKEIKIDRNHSKNYAKMELNTKDQKGLIAHLMIIFDELGVDIATAKIHTHKNRARDLFLIEKNRNFCQNIGTIIKKLASKV